MHRAWLLAASLWRLSQCNPASIIGPQVYVDSMRWACLKQPLPPHPPSAPRQAAAHACTTPVAPPRRLAVLSSDPPPHTHTHRKSNVNAKVPLCRGTQGFPGIHIHCGGPHFACLFGPMLSFLEHKSFPAR
jgi:hypothetical protein